MRISIFGLVTAVTCIVLCIIPYQAQAENYTFTILEAPGSSDATAHGINDSGQVVGRYYIGGTSQGFLYSGGSFTPINVPGALRTDAAGINDSGQIVGTGGGGFLYSGGSFTPINVPGAVYTWAFGINASGQIVGRYSDVTGTHGFLYSGGSFTPINVPGAAAETHVLGINNNGQIVGYYSNTSGTYGFLGTPAVNASPICSAAQAFPAAIWAPNHHFLPVVVLGVTDPDGDTVTILVTGVTQDEPVRTPGSDTTSPDAVIQAGAASVRAERLNTGNGRVYHVSFQADDSSGGTCAGAVTISVPHSMKKGVTAIDDGQAYDSTVP